MTRIFEMDDPHESDSTVPALEEIIFRDGRWLEKNDENPFKRTLYPVALGPAYIKLAYNFQIDQRHIEDYIRKILRDDPFVRENATSYAWSSSKIDKELDVIAIVLFRK